jgi:hypothetical protein
MNLLVSTSRASAIAELFYKFLNPELKGSLALVRKGIHSSISSRQENNDYMRFVSRV